MASNSPDSSPHGSSGRTSQSLLEQVAGRNTQAWQRLADLYGPLVFHWCKRSQLNDDDAGDVMQDVFASVSRGIDRFIANRNGSGTFRGWLKVITRNCIADHYRRQSQQVRARGGTDANLELFEVASVLREDDSSGDERRAESLLFKRATDLIQTEFTSRTWEAFWRAVIEGHAAKDIAADMGITPNAVRQAKSRVLRRLRAELGDQG